MLCLLLFPLPGGEKGKRRHEAVFQLTFTEKVRNQSIDPWVAPHLTRGTMSFGSRGLSAVGPPSVWIWICLPKIHSQLLQHKPHLARRIVSLLQGCNWSTLYTAISLDLYQAQPAKSALLRCHFITHSLAVCAHVAPGSWSMAVSLLHQQRSSFLTRTEMLKEHVVIKERKKKQAQQSVTARERVGEPWCSSFQK